MLPCTLVWSFKTKPQRFLQFTVLFPSTLTLIFDFVTLSFVVLDELFVVDLAVLVSVHEVHHALRLLVRQVAS